MDNNQINLKRNIKLILDSSFWCLDYLIPAFYSFAWFVSISKIQDLIIQENIYKRIGIFLLIFILFYLVLLLLLNIFKSIIYRITGLRKNLMGLLRLEVARIFISLPGLRKFVKATPLRDYDEQLYKKLIDWCRIHGNDIDYIQVLHVKHYSRETNAYFLGVGKLSKIVIYDTLFDLLTHSEIEALIAHEFGHKHDFQSNLSIVLTRMVGAALIAGSGFWYMAIIRTIKPLPLFILLLIIYWFFTLLLDNSISKYNEIFADTYAIFHISNSDDFKNMLIKLAFDNYDAITPPRLIEFLFFSHPSTAKRLTNIESYQKFFQKSVCSVKE